MKKIISSTILLLVFNFSFSQYIEGKVLDVETNKPIEGVHVYMNEIGKGTMTNDKGNYYLKFPFVKVKSAVIRMERNTTSNLACDEKLFFRVVKSGFNQRRKTLRNSLKSVLGDHKLDDELMSKRPEQLSVEQFVYLTNKVGELINMELRE